LEKKLDHLDVLGTRNFEGEGFQVVNADLNDHIQFCREICIVLLPMPWPGAVNPRSLCSLFVIKSFNKRL